MNVIRQAVEIIEQHGLNADLHARELVAHLDEAGMLVSDEPERDEIMSFRTHGNNSHLVADLFTLGYLTDDMEILDPTYGLGVFWKRHRPPKLVASDIKPSADFVFEQDFTQLPYEGESFDAVVFDPDYKMQGTDSGAGPASSNARYGMDRDYRPVMQQLGMIGMGLKECVRVCRRRGVIVVKCMDQVVSGSVTWQTIRIANTMEDLNCVLEDALHLEGYRRQPTTDECHECKGTGKVPHWDGEPLGVMVCAKCQGAGRVQRRQVHARRNYSSMLVFRKGR
jgi:hypothetical protein